MARSIAGFLVYLVAGADPENSRKASQKLIPALLYFPRT